MSAAAVGSAVCSTVASTLASSARGTTLHVREGSALLDGAAEGPSLAAHVSRYGEQRPRHLRDLLAALDSVALRGRGGAGFPFATKLRAAAEARGRPSVVVNLSEGEPASLKDAALALTRPHLILDGAALAAHALGAHTAHVVLPGDRPSVQSAMRRALTERNGRDGSLRWKEHLAEGRFVAGQARAVIELMSGRPGLPVTAWEPEARKGYRGRPTLLSNAETFAQLGFLVLAGADRVLAHGTGAEPGTLLLTVHRYGGVDVVEVDHGTPWSDVLDPALLGRPVLVGGYHGTWAAPGVLGGLTVSRGQMTQAGLALGAGVVLPLGPGDCPVHRTSEITAYLAAQSAGRCGPCVNGLPALAGSVRELAAGLPSTERAHDLARLVTRRGACAHPDGTARMVESMLASFGAELDEHAHGRCAYVGKQRAS